MALGFGDFDLSDIPKKQSISLFREWSIDIERQIINTKPIKVWNFTILHYVKGYPYFGVLGA